MLKLLPLSLLLSAFSAFADVTLYKILSEHDDTRVQFVSDAPMEKVVGKTQAAMGFVEFDPDGGAGNVRGEIHVDLASITTGVKLRDRHMRENHLETDTYPEAVFTLKSMLLPPEGLVAGKRTPVEVNGSFALHGVERSITPTVYLTRMQTDVENLKIEADFSVKLADYDIKRPQFLLLKLSEVQEITVELVASESTASALAPVDHSN